LREVISFFEKKKSLIGLKEIANFFGVSPCNLSGARNGKREYLSDEFFLRVWKAGGKIYSLNWLLYGVGKKFNEELLAAEDVGKDEIIKALKDTIGNKDTYIKTLEGYVEVLKEKRGLAEENHRPRTSGNTLPEKGPKRNAFWKCCRIVVEWKNHQ
jgi:hypothetical protein